jgi:hypothetical protein
MPSPYDLPMRWLEWHERWPVPEIESLKRQIGTIKRVIESRESERASIEKFTPPEYKQNVIDVLDRNYPSLDDLNEVLATLERMMPNF